MELIPQDVVMPIYSFIGFIGLGGFKKGSFRFISHSV